MRVNSKDWKHFHHWEIVRIRWYSPQEEGGLLCAASGTDLEAGLAVWLGCNNTDESCDLERVTVDPPGGGIAGPVSV